MLEIVELKVLPKLSVMVAKTFPKSFYSQGSPGLAIYGAWL